jgi:hypothetical protein
MTTLLVFSRARFVARASCTIALVLSVVSIAGFLSNLLSAPKLRAMALHDFAVMRRAEAPSPNWLLPSQLHDVAFAADLPCPRSPEQVNLSTLQRLLLPTDFQRPKDWAQAGPVWAYLQVEWWFLPFLAQTSLGWYEGFQGYKGWSSISYDRKTCHFCFFGTVVEITSAAGGCNSN